MVARGYFLPPSIQPQEFTALHFGELRVEVPILTPASLHEIIDAVTKRREEYLARCPLKYILEVIDETIRRWVDREAPLRREAERALSVITRFSPPMIAHGLDLMLREYRGETILAWLREELGDPRCLDEFHQRVSGEAVRSLGGRRCKAHGPRLVMHVLAGNLPALAIPSLVLGLVTKAANLVKIPSEEPYFTAAFVQTMAEVEPRIGECLAVLWWRGGSAELEEVALDRAEVVMAYGTDEAIDSIRPRVRGRFLGFGHRVSFGVIAREALEQLPDVAQRAAYDASMYDQQGCLSPHGFYVEEGGAASAKQFAEALAEAMEALQRTLPAGRPTLEEAAAIRALRGAYESRSLARESVAVYESRDGVDWTVIYEEDPTFRFSCLHRTIYVKPVQDVMDVPRWVAPQQRHLQAVGVEGPESRLGALAEALGALGVSRICPLGKMQEPPVGWHNGGWLGLAEILRWVDWERQVDVDCPVA